MSFGWVSVDILRFLSLRLIVKLKEEREGHEVHFGVKSTLVVKSRKSKKSAPWLICRA
jgi:hypothetical protein